MARRDSPYPADFDDGVQKDIESRGLEYEVLRWPRLYSLTVLSDACLNHV